MFKFAARAPPFSWKVVKNCFFFFRRSQKTQYLMSLFVAGRKALCAVAQIIGGGFSAGEGKLKVTPGWKARHDAFFLSALQLKLQTLYSSLRSTSESSLTGAAQSLWQTQTLIPCSLPINLLYPGLNMSRVDVTLRLCRRQTE